MLPLLFVAALLVLALTGGRTDGPQTARVDCAPRPGDRRTDCLERGCLWNDHFEPLNPTVPFCYFPRASGYLVDGDASRSRNLTELRLRVYKAGAKNPYDTALPQLAVTARQIRGSTLKLTITDATAKRFVPPVPLNEGNSCASDACTDSGESLRFYYSSTPVFSFTVSRQSNGEKIWDTSIGGMTFADKFIQIATYLPTDRIYGFGDHIHQTFKHDFSTYRTWAMFSIDEATNSVTQNSNNHYGVLPFYLGFDATTGKAHGVLIFNSNAQEVVTGPAPHLIYRTIGGRLDIYYFAGPTAEDVVRQYQDLVGRPFLPSYWAFGFQLCRFKFTGVADIRAAVKRTTDAKIPLDVIYSDIDYMDRYKDFTLSQQPEWANFSAFVDEIHDQNMKVILIFDPAVQVNDDAFRRALDQNAKFIEWPRKDLVPSEIQDQYPLAKDTKVMLGVVWPDAHVAFPDFLDPTNLTQQWWIDEFQKFHKKIAFDGIWIDMNEPSNFETNEKSPNYPTGHPKITPLRCPIDASAGADAAFDAPLYATWHVYNRGSAKLSSKTLCMFARSGRGSYVQYDVHSLYGWAESMATSAALHATVDERSSLFSRSTFPGSGAHAGHWLGDNFAHWEDLRTSIIGIQEFNIFGIPFVGADVCGFIGATNEELCLRWQQLGAFYPFFRNHNDDSSPPQDPAQWSSVAIAARAANLYRYQNLPYLYSLHMRASLFGGTVIRPLFFEFPGDAMAAQVADTQFMWGSSLIIIPVTAPDVDFVHGYLPPNETWYSASFAHNYGVRQPTGFSDFDAPRGTPLPVFIRGGSAIPRQRPSQTLTESRANELQLLIALNDCGTASGEMFWDDGKSLFTDARDHDYVKFTFTVSVTSDRTDVVIHCEENCNSVLIRKIPPLGTVEVFGYEYQPFFSGATVDGHPAVIDKQRSFYSATKCVLKIESVGGLIQFSRDGPTTWTLSLPNLLFLHVPRDMPPPSINITADNKLLPKKFD